MVRNGTTVNYRYDGLGRRVEKEINDGATTKVTRYVMDNEDILLELDGSNNIVARYTHGPGIDEPLILEKGGASFFYHADGLGSITEITNQTGSVVQAYTYSSFGKIESQLDPNFIQPYTFTAREFDPETGLLHLRNRYYDPFTGIFVTQDPLNFASVQLPPQTQPIPLSQVDVPLKALLRNLVYQHTYVYAGNNPIRYSDPSGLEIFLLGRQPPFIFRYPGVARPAPSQRFIPPRPGQQCPLRPQGPSIRPVFEPAPSPIPPPSWWAQFLEKLADFLGELGAGGVSSPVPVDLYNAFNPFTPPDA